MEPNAARPVHSATRAPRRYAVTENWQRRLARPIMLADGRKLATLNDVRAFTLALPFPTQTLMPWQYVARFLLEAAENGDTDTLCDQLEHALGTEGLAKNQPRQHYGDGECEPNPEQDELQAGAAVDRREITAGARLHDGVM